MARKFLSMAGRDIPAPRFVIIACLMLFLPLLVSGGMVLLKIPTNKNQVVAWRQLDKLAAANNDIDTIILGDSSGGMAIDAALFSRLTGKKAVSLVLTGAFGIHGNFLLLAHAKHKFPNLRYVYFIISTGTWAHDLSNEAYYLLREGLPASLDPFAGIPEAEDALKEYINWLFTPERFVWLWNNAQEPVYEQGIWDEEFDYIVQGPVLDAETAHKKWAVHMVVPTFEKLIPYLDVWKSFCDQYACILAHGPLYSGFAESSHDSIAAIDDLIKAHLEPSLLHYEKQLYLVEHQLLGDDFNHIHPDYRQTSTGYYAQIFKNAVN